MKNDRLAMRKTGFSVRHYLAEEKVFTGRWSRERKKTLIREDIRDATTIQKISQLEHLMLILPDRVGSVFSLNAIREDLSVAYNTLAGWMDILEYLYYLYRIYPYFNTQTKSLKKEPKLFFWDYTELDDAAAKWENLIGNHLLKQVHYWQDFLGIDVELKYLRDRDKREVDFLITYKHKPLIAVEVKQSTEKVSKHLLYFKEKLAIPYCYQVLEKTGVDFEYNGVRVISADKFLTGLV